MLVACHYAFSAVTKVALLNDNLLLLSGVSCNQLQSARSGSEIRHFPTESSKDVTMSQITDKSEEKPNRLVTLKILVFLFFGGKNLSSIYLHNQVKAPPKCFLFRLLLTELNFRGKTNSHLKSLSAFFETAKKISSFL